MADKPEKANTAKGFSGLDAMVSDVTSDVEVAARKGRHRKWGKAGRSDDQASGDGKPKTDGTTWVAGAIGLLTLLLCIFDPDFNPSSRNRGARVDPPPPAVQAKPRVPETVAPVLAAVTTAPAVPGASLAAMPVNGIIGEAPPLNDSHPLNIEQYRYCLAEKIRISSISDVLVPSRQRETVAYNNRVTDFASRCADNKFGLHPSQKVKAEVDAQSAAIAREAKDSWQQSWIVPTIAGQGKAEVVRGAQAPVPQIENVPEPVMPAPRVEESWTTGPYAREMSALNEQDRTAIQSACAIEKKTGGRAPFLRCVGVQLGKLSQ